MGYDLNFSIQPPQVKTDVSPKEPVDSPKSKTCSKIYDISKTILLTIGGVFAASAFTALMVFKAIPIFVGLAVGTLVTLGTGLILVVCDPKKRDKTKTEIPNKQPTVIQPNVVIQPNIIPAQSTPKQQFIDFVQGNTYPNGKKLWGGDKANHILAAINNPKTFLNWVQNNAYLNDDQKKVLTDQFNNTFNEQPVVIQPNPIIQPNIISTQTTPKQQFVDFVQDNTYPKGKKLWGGDKANHIINAMNNPKTFLSWAKNNGHLSNDQWQEIFDQYNALFNQQPAGIPIPSAPHHQSPQHVFLDNKFGNARVVPGTVINKENLDVGIGGFNVSGQYGYDWSVVYGKNSTHTSDFWRNSDFAEKAVNTNSGVLIGSNGTLSHFQKVPLFKDINKKSTKFATAEHILHFYKVPPGVKVPGAKNTYRKEIVGAKTAGAALTVAGKASKIKSANQWGEDWGEASRHLGVYLQLLKASNEKTKMYELLINSGDQFIIEDTSYRQEKNHNGNPKDLNPEKYWGDNGDGTGENKLGWCQMEARRIIRQQYNGQMPTPQEVQDYFDNEVAPKLLAYYKKCWGYQGSKVD